MQWRKYYRDFSKYQLLELKRVNFEMKSLAESLPQGVSDSDRRKRANSALINKTKIEVDYHKQLKDKQDYYVIFKNN